MKMKSVDNIQFVASPVFELLASMFRLNVHEKLLDHLHESSPTYAQLDQWVRQTRKTLTPSLREELDVFFHYESFIGLSLVSKSFKENAYHTFDEFIAFLEDLPAYDLFYSFLQTGFTPKEINNIKDREEVLDYIKNSNLPQVEKWKLTYLYLDVDNTKDRFIHLVQKCWNVYFADELEDIQKKQQESIDQLIREYGVKNRESLYRVFPFLNRDHAIPEDTVIISAPSVFYYISSLTSSSDTDNMFLHLFGTEQPAFNMKGNMNEGELLESFKKLADEKRLKMIRILSIRPSYGHELAQKLEVSNSTVSHHLSTLSSMGIVKATRKDSRVYYEVNKMKLKELMAKITDALID
ncbi:DNA-binding transcriptional ArsR family regulator [Salirhabdus euzebyi]|uniref:DNA-binding transcriptional ArsR family regulator n=1 Tax=Salirhabdus euzebyi TaxID=394506 RepID=A0A841Q4U2_9BACI|nr:metalloregulator ArsR/SmtB family transcription factor [Salirhabdus euzebyi]MBB6453362.1 DNA-binding transcriptional ArsR family regulator [Salirhabdus euzebyi]